MAARPVGVVDCLLAAVQGVGNFLALYRTQGAGANSSVEEILANSFAVGAVAGVASLFLMAVIYQRLGIRAGGKATITQVVHVLAYGGVPMAASVVLWVLTALLAGESAFVETPRADVEGFVVLLLHVQFAAYVLLLVWSVVLIVMGLSEIEAVGTRKALGVWFIGQVIGFLASVFLALVIGALFPGILRLIPQH
jgi:hypothetical protein